MAERDASKLLIYRGGQIRETLFRHLPDCLPDGALLVFNNTRVIRARLLFRKDTGAMIEIFCLEPAVPSDYEQSFAQTDHCTWHCLVGNSKRWKSGQLHTTVTVGGEPVTLSAERVSVAGEAGDLVDFRWDNPRFTFSDVLEAVGVLPIPPYLHRETEAQDLQTYQTVYSKVKGSVAAPTAGLHFTPAVLAELDARGIEREEVTLHVGAGTFRPVKSDTIGGHAMHTEHFAVTRRTVDRLLAKPEHVIAVGTTSVRTLESLYYIGCALARGGADESADGAFTVGQWTPYDADAPTLTAEEALRAILCYLDRRGMDRLWAATQIIIAPGYQFKIVRGMVTNFHQPQSTLLLLVSAFVGGDWRTIYDYALAHDFRFLSYGDSSL
ncbi:S-adenosylmethionine tRNA ribosyltransferase, partial [Tannerella sp. oral taxon BU063 isolate Cell 1/3]